MFCYPYQYQQKLINEYKPANEEALKSLQKAISDGHQVMLWAQLSGPYMNYNKYWISDDRIIEVVEPASLHWVPTDIMKPEWL